MNINPFDNLIVSEPRRIEKPVSGLNDRALNELAAQFETLEKENYPRATRLSGAQFVLSPQPGYGKSHLIGRLFKQLRGRATLVYIRPFTHAASCWRSILLKMVQEMEFPDSAEAEFRNKDESTQLEALVHGILMNIVVSGLEDGSIKFRHQQTALDYFKQVTLQQLRARKKWVKWVDEKTSALAYRLNRFLKRTGVKLNASPESWLKVLVKYAYFPSDFETRQACLDWLRGGSVNIEEARHIGIQSTDRIPVESSIELMNEACKDRILDFCALAGFYRPFVLCFDQTENYGLEQLLSQTLGLVIQVLVDDGINQMTVITANQQPWDETLKSRWQRAHLDRLRRPYYELEPLNRDQGKELIQNRLAAIDGEEQNPLSHLGTAWLDELFRDIPEYGVRQFLDACKQRWEEVTQGAVPAPDLEFYYLGYVNKIKGQPKRMVFDPDILYWLVSEVAGDLPGLSVEKFAGQKGYFSLVWKLKDRRVLFGFEAGSNWNRWKAIHREAREHYQAQSKSKVVFLRTPDLKVIPAPGWTIAPEIQEAKQHYLHIITLTKSDMANLYAAYDLCVDAAEGDLPFTREEVLAFVRNKLQQFWSRVSEPSPSNWEPGRLHHADPLQPEAKTQLVETLREILGREKFMSMQDLMAKLPQWVSEEDVHAVRGSIPEIKLHVGPGTTVLQWQPK
jgi:hypothetical protein